jgi:hypothetical protein
MDSGHDELPESARRTAARQRLPRILPISATKCDVRIGTVRDHLRDLQPHCRPHRCQSALFDSAHTLGTRGTSSEFFPPPPPDRHEQRSMFRRAGIRSVMSRRARRMRSVGDRDAGAANLLEPPAGVAFGPRTGSFG